jgi:four helix bundle protein
MGSFKCFEDLQVWQKSREVTREIYSLTTEAAFSRDYGLREQIRRASVSIMANIAEGFGRHSDKEFANFLNIAHGSVAEVQSHLYVALDLGYLAQTEFSKLYESLNEISKMSYSLAKRLR